MLLSEFLNRGNRCKLTLVPIPGVIRLPETAEFRREATRLRRGAAVVFSGQKPPRQRIVRKNRDTFFLRQREEFSLGFTEQQVVTRLGRDETRLLQGILPSKRFRQTIGEKVRN